MENKMKIIYISLAVISIIFPLLASANPDGLEATLERVSSGYQEMALFSGLFPDYEIPSLGAAGSSISVLLGTALVLILSRIYLSGLSSDGGKATAE